jgi:response regulator RpfG family c-di-GMP phosphodiesterase
MLETLVTLLPEPALLTGRVLCIDDEQNILKALRRLLMSQNIEIETESDPKQAVIRLKTEAFNVIICDMRMPDLSGAEVLEQAALLQPDAFRILMTGYADIASTIAAVNLGKIQRYIAKPWDNEALLAAIREGLKYSNLLKHNKALQLQVEQQNLQLRDLNQALESKVELRTAQLSKSLRQLKLSMQQVENNHQYLLKVLYNQMNIHPMIDGRFAISVSYLAKSLARQLALEPGVQQQIALAAKLAEIGLIGVSHLLLQKPLHQLDANEWTRYREHVRFAAEILSPAPALAGVADMIGSQYENFNGTGYPEQKAAELIPIGSRVIAVARDYQALLQGRLLPVRVTQATALAHIRAQQGTIYDPLVVMALAQVTGNQLAEPELQPDATEVNLQQLQPGMRLKHNVYNQKNMLLLPEGFVLTAASLAKLQQILADKAAELYFQIDTEYKAETESS